VKPFTDERVENYIYAMLPEREPVLQEMERQASEQFKQRHPTVADEIVKAFAWCYTFDFK